MFTKLWPNEINLNIIWLTFNQYSGLQTIIDLILNHQKMSWIILNWFRIDFAIW